MAKIKPGYDLFSVVRRSTQFDFKSIFKGAGYIRLEGVPIDPINLGNFCTGIERKGEVPEEQSCVVPIEMFAEHSIAIAPIHLAPFGMGPSKGELHTLINRGGMFDHLINTDGLVKPSTGVMSVQRNGKGGGRFEIAININPLIVITKVGGSIRNINSPDILKIIDGSGVLNPVVSIGGQWSESISEKIKVKRNATFKTGGFFVATDRISLEPVRLQLTSLKRKASRMIELAVEQ